MRSTKLITQMENIKNEQAELLQQMERLLGQIEGKQQEYHSLIEYYYSQQRNQDLEDDRNGKLPEDLERGVLSEDEIFDLIGDYYDCGVRMMEVGLSMIRRT